MNLLQRVVGRLTGARAKALAAENARLRARIEKLQKQRDMFPRKLANAERRGMSDAVMSQVIAQLGPGDTVVDCGANVGEVTAQLAATGAMVHAFEPDPHALSILRRKFGGTPNVILHAVAVGAKTGSVPFFRLISQDDDPERSPQGNSTMGAHLKARPVNMETIDVPMIDFPAFVADLLDKGARIPFVKIDVEGAELDILPAMLAQGLFDRIGLTAAETHEFQIADRADDFAALRAAITARYPKSRVNLDWI